jgi:hypothetical protein
MPREFWQEFQNFFPFAKSRPCRKISPGRDRGQQSEIWRTVANVAKRGACGMSQKNLDPTALTVEQAAELVTKAGKRRLQPAEIKQDIEAGAPTNGDGTINLVNYAAWLIANGK